MKKKKVLLMLLPNKKLLLSVINCLIASIGSEPFSPLKKSSGSNISASYCTTSNVTGNKTQDYNS